MQKGYLKKRNRNRAFTLVEILLALAIISIVMTTLYATFSNSLAIIKSTKDRALESRRRMILYKIIESDIQNIFYTRDKKKHFFKAQKRDSGNRHTDRVSFISLSSGLSRFSKVGDLREIGYFVKETGESPFGEPLFHLYRREQIGVDELPDKGGHISLLAKGIQSFSVECASALGKIEWIRGWDNKRRNKYPIGLKISIRFPVPNNPEAYEDLIVIGQIRQQKPTLKY